MIVFTNDYSANLPILKPRIYLIQASMQNLVLDIGIRNILRSLSPERSPNQKIFPNGRFMGILQGSRNGNASPNKLGNYSQHTSVWPNTALVFPLIRDMKVW